MTESVFDRLRTLVLARMGVSHEIVRRMDVVPLEQTVDGWYCLLGDGQVAHVKSDGADDELVSSPERATALIGNLATRFPIATWFVPRSVNAHPCPVCKGTGITPGLPSNLAAQVVCRCGGLGWVPS